MTGVPVLYNSTQISKDAALDFTITYRWDSNNPQQTGNIVKIYNNETNELVYSLTTEKYYRQECIIPANTLTNGILYKVTVQVICSEGTSEPSEPQLFYCYSTPTLSFTNLSQNQIIENSAYTAELRYSQEQGEELESYYFVLYSSSMSVIYTTSVRYDTENLKVTVNNLENNTQYYFKAFGTTITGMSTETEAIQVSVRYMQPTLYSLIELSNNYHGGYTTIRSNIISLRAHVLNKEGEEVDPIYINGEFIDVRDGTNTVNFTEGFDITGDFTLELKGFGFEQNKVLLQISNGSTYMNAYYRLGNFENSDNTDVIYVELQVFDQMTYTIYSNYLPVPANPNELLGFMLTRQKNHYELIFHDYNEEVSVE